MYFGIAQSTYTPYEIGRLLCTNPPDGTDYWDLKMTKRAQNYQCTQLGMLIRSMLRK